MLKYVNMQRSLAINHISKESLDKARLKELISKFSTVKILVCGDLILDEYLSGYPSRISREAPVLILKYQDSRFTLGGSSNAANNIAALGAEVKLIGTLGDDYNAGIFRDLCTKLGVELDAIVDKSKPTTTKTRVVSSSSANPDAGTVVQQQVLRIDREFSEDISTEISKQVEGAYAASINDCDAVLLSDYENGNLNDANTQFFVKTANEAKKKSIVDSQGNLLNFKSASHFTPNQPDLEKFTGSKISNDEELLEQAKQVQADLESEDLLVTRGGKGMTLVSKKSADFIPAFNLSEVFDVSGAGDTVSAAYSIALAAGASAQEAAILGNLAASIVVKKYGTATTNQEELIELIDSL